MNIERGAIYRVNLDPTIGSEQQGNARPCVVLTLTAYNLQLRTVGVVPLTSSPRALPPLIVPVPSASKANSMALCHQIRTIDKTRIGKLLEGLTRWTWLWWKTVYAGFMGCRKTPINQDGCVYL